MIERERLGSIAASVDDAHADLVERKAAQRMVAGDHTLWQQDATEVADRLGWLHVGGDMADADLHIEHGADIALLGMGGSSLFPEVLFRSFPGSVNLHALDTTDPAAVARVPVDGTTFIVASKSGTTIETMSQLAHFWDATGGEGSRFVAITDPGTALAELGRSRGFQRVFENRPDIGGRYSALSYFGLVPGAALGVDVEGELLGPARDMPLDDGTRFGAILGAAAKSGRDKLTVLLPERLASFGLWIEQLVAESTGKHGTGIVPVVGEPRGRPDVYGEDRIFVAIGEHDTDELAAAGHPVVDIGGRLGALVMLWEVGVALAGAVLGINPFDQPDVQSAKDATSRVLREGLPAIADLPAGSLLEEVKPGDYVALLAFVDPGNDRLLRQLDEVRLAIRDRLRVATTIGVGPRFLHSTGQLHKGGPPTGVFVQLVGDDDVDVPIPGQPYGFSTLKRAQAAGDLVALQQRGLRAGRVTIESLLEVTQ